MNKNIFIYLLFVLVILSAAVSAVSASENITEPALLSVGESYIAQDDTLSLSYEESIDDDQTLNLPNEEIIEDDNGTLSLSDGDNTDVLQFGELVETNYGGSDYVQMSNGYTVFCADRLGAFPKKAGVQYYTVEQYQLIHDYTKQRVDNKLRLAIVYYAENPAFKEEKTLLRVALGGFSRTQHLIWFLSHYDSLDYMDY